MQDAARMPLRPDSAGLPAQALALLLGVGACLLLPRLPAWPWMALLLVMGAALWLRRRRGLLLGALLCGFGLAGLHAGASLSGQLPVALEQHEFEVSGRVLDLPQHEPRRTRFVLRVDDAPEQAPALRGKRLQLAWYDDFKLPPGTSPPRLRLHAGSRWRMAVKLHAPRGLRNPGGFDGEKQDWLPARSRQRPTARARHRHRRLA